MRAFCKKTFFELRRPFSFSFSNLFFATYPEPRDFSANRCGYSKLFTGVSITYQVSNPPGKGRRQVAAGLLAHGANTWPLSHVTFGAQSQAMEMALTMWPSQLLASSGQ